MVNPMSISGQAIYGIKEFVIDTEEDIEKLPTDVPAGSAALIVKTGDVAVLSNAGTWEVLK